MSVIRIASIIGACLFLSGLGASAQWYKTRLDVVETQLAQQDSALAVLVEYNSRAAIEKAQRHRQCKASKLEGMDCWDVE